MESVGLELYFSMKGERVEKEEPNPNQIGIHNLNYSMEIVNYHSFELNM